MARVAAADGVSTIIATPHIQGNLPSKEQIMSGCRALNTAIRQQGLALEVLPGAETYAMADTELLTQTPLNDSRYILIEFPLTHLPTNASQVIFNLRVRGFWPIIAHPERIPSVIANPSLLQGLLDEQVFVQITAGSLNGVFGSGPKKCARFLLKKGLVHFIASDGHAADMRPPGLSRGLEIAGRIIGRDAARRLVYDNPGAVITGGSIET